MSNTKNDVDMNEMIQQINYPLNGYHERKHKLFNIKMFWMLFQGLLEVDSRKLLSRVRILFVHNVISIHENHINSALH